MNSQFMTSDATQMRASRMDGKAMLAQEDAARADLYAVLARLFFSAPDQALLLQLAASDVSAAAEADEAPLPKAWASLCRAAARTDSAAVQAEYEARFISVGKPQVMLYASYYLTGFMMEKPLAKLRHDLAALGLGRLDGVAEPEDHFAALAEVMRLIITDSSGSPAQRAARQKEFFMRHVAPWYAQFCAAIAAVPGRGFYYAVGRFAEAFLDVEAESFQIETV
jgi:TorA maturation chaperone TorD